jgi:hypothetical protein
MNGKILLATLAAVVLLAFAAPAMAQCGACGGVAYGAPQDCVATISCNVPVTQQVPYITTTCVPQEIQVPVCTPVQSSITVPRQIMVPQQITVMVPQCVPEEVPITTYTTTCVPQEIQVPVPVTAYQPVTTMVPQCYTVPMGANAPMGGISKEANAPMGVSKEAGAPMESGLSKGLEKGGMSKGGAAY